MQYERFLFTRNQRRDFTAFVRPVHLTNKDVSVIANAFNYINDVTVLTRDFPALYCFPLGAYTLLLRHYDSGRRHAGREIGVIEGIAIAREHEDAFARRLPHLIEHHNNVLNVTAGVGDLEDADVQTSAMHEWDALSETADADAHSVESELVHDFPKRYANDRLMLPFTHEGLALLLHTLALPDLPNLDVAFGTNADVVTQLKTAAVDFDIVGYFTTTEPAHKPREGVKVIDPTEILPEAAKVPSYFAPTMLPVAEPSPLPDDTQPVQVTSGKPRRTVLQTLVDLLLGRR